MPRRLIDRIRERIRLRQYDMTAHAMEEMAEDDLDIFDIERAVLSGRVTRIDKDDPRGIRYTVEGVGADDETLIGVVGRFATPGRYVIITVFAVEE